MRKITYNNWKNTNISLFFYQQQYWDILLSVLKKLNTAFTNLNVAFTNQNVSLGIANVSLGIANDSFEHRKT